MSARRAVSVTLPPGPKASTSNSNFCSSLHRRRRSVPVISVEYAMLLLTPLQTTLLAVQLCLNHRKTALTGGVLSAGPHRNRHRLQIRSSGALAFRKSRVREASAQCDIQIRLDAALSVPQGLAVLLFAVGAVDLA